MSSISTRQRTAVLYSLLATAIFLLLLVKVENAGAQEEVTDTDIRAADSFAATYSISDFRYHIRAANTPASRVAAASNAVGAGQVTASRNLISATSPPALPAPGFYPGDVTYFGGRKVVSAKSHDIYLNCASTCWGNPAGFLTDFGDSTFVHVLDQYSGSTANDRYTLGQSVAIKQTLFTNTLGQHDLLAMVHAAIVALGGSTFAGYGHIYHIFLPKGVDTCFDQTSICYSPDNPNSFAFCAYHGSVTFSDIGHALYTVEPYQNVAGCNEAPPFARGAVADSTNTTLSHELSETISDPDIDSWFSINPGTFGEEIGDLCISLINNNGAEMDPVSTLNGKKYKIQLEYSDRYHGCANVP